MGRNTSPAVFNPPSGFNFSSLMDASRPSVHIQVFPLESFLDVLNTLSARYSPTGPPTHALAVLLKLVEASGVPEIGSCFTCRLIKRRTFFVFSEKTTRYHRPVLERR